MRRFALDRLLEGVDPSRAQSFVGQCVVTLLAHDERHGRTLAAILELTLECPTRDDAARAAFCTAARSAAGCSRRSSSSTSTSMIPISAWPYTWP